MEPSPPDVLRLVEAANAARWKGDPSAPVEDAAAADAERRLEALFRTSQRLAVYGTLAPGRSNHHVVAPLGGEWTDGVVEGDLRQAGWKATFGFPAFRPRAGGAAVPVHLLTTPGLAAAWPRLDAFEGPAYRRILVPVLLPGPAEARRIHTVANLYAAAASFPDDATR